MPVASEIPILIKEYDDTIAQLAHREPSMSKHRWAFRTNECNNENAKINNQQINYKDGG